MNTAIDHNSIAINKSICLTHQVEAKYFCPTCDSCYCSDCARLVGIATRAICQQCDSFCHSIKELNCQAVSQTEQQLPFGWSDLHFAWRYPLQNWLAVIQTGAFFGFLLCFTLFGFPIILGFMIMFSCAWFIIKDISAGNFKNQYVFDFTEMLSEIGSAATRTLSVLLMMAIPLAAILFIRFQFNNNISLLLVCLLVVALSCYYPVLMMIAGYTGSASAVLNPQVGINVVRCLAPVFSKFLKIYLVLCLCGLLLTIVIAFFAANLHPIWLSMIIGIPVFYTNMVIATLVGRMIYKNHDQLGITNCLAN